jgi:hypothetical protein
MTMVLNSELKFALVARKSKNSNCKHTRLFIVESLFFAYIVPTHLAGRKAHSVERLLAAGEPLANSQVALRYLPWKDGMRRIQGIEAKE